MLVDFGQYKGADTDDILTEDPAYLVWVYENVDNQEIVDEDLYAEASDKLLEIE